MRTIAKHTSRHGTIKNAMDDCRNGRELQIELPDQTITIRCEQEEIRHRFFVKHRGKEIEGLQSGNCCLTTSSASTET